MRLIALFRAHAASSQRIVVLGVGLGLLPALFIVRDFGWWYTAAALAVFHFGLIWTEKRQDARAWGRLLTLVMCLILPIGVNTQHATSLAPWIVSLGTKLTAGGVFSTKLVPSQAAHALAIAFCLLLSLAEPNALVGMLTKAWGVEPAEEDRERLSHNSDLVGILERALVFTVVALGAYNAAAFILTAKGLVKFHETKDKDTAAYVLVGTFLSSLCAFACGLFATWLLA